MFRASIFDAWVARAACAAATTVFRSALASSPSRFSTVPSISVPRVSSEAPPDDEPYRAYVRNRVHKDLVQSPPEARTLAYASPSPPGLHHALVGIVAQEIYRGESLLFLRKASRLRQRAQSLSARHPPAPGPKPAENPYPGRCLDEARLRLHLLPEGVQGHEGSVPCSLRRGTTLRLLA